MTVNKEERPILKIELSFLDKFVEILGWFILIMFWIMTVLNYSNLPSSIPTHFDFVGRPDGFGDKSTIFVLPVLCSVLYLGMTILNRFPHIFNYPTKITNQNAERQYAIATRLIRYLKLIIVLTFSTIGLMTSLTANNKLSGLGIGFLPVFLGLVIVILIFSLFKFLKKTE
jgi:uncharacterized membrane protein